MSNNSDREVDKLLSAFSSGQLSRKDLVRAIRGNSQTESSVPDLLSRVFSGIPLRWHSVSVPIEHLVATEVQLERRKYRLVTALFPDADTFEKNDKELFPGFPLMGISLGDGRVAIIDGHHRIRRFFEIATPDSTLEIKILTSADPRVHESYQRQVETVEEANGSASIFLLPIKP